MLDPDVRVLLDLRPAQRCTVIWDMPQNCFVAAVMAQGSLICASKQLRWQNHFQTGATKPILISLRYQPYPWSQKHIPSSALGSLLAHYLWRSGLGVGGLQMLHVVSQQVMERPATAQSTSTCWALSAIGTTLSGTWFRTTLCFWFLESWISLNNQAKTHLYISLHII